MANEPSAFSVEFLDMGTLEGGLLEFPLLRTPRGEIFGGSATSRDNPDRIIFRVSQDYSVTFMGVMSHVGKEHQGFTKRKFIVSDLYSEYQI